MFGNNNSGIGAGIGSFLKVQPLKTCNITSYGQYTTLSGGSILTLPNAEPGTAQVSYTVTSTMLPTYAGDLPALMTNGGFLNVGCINNGASGRTLNWRVKRNGVSIGTGSQSITASNKGILQFYSLVGANKINIGDVLEIFLWCTESATDMQLIQYALSVIPVAFRPVNNMNKVITNVSFAFVNTTLTNFVNNASINTQYGLLPMSGTSSTGIQTSGTLSQLITSENSLYGVASSWFDAVPYSAVTNTNNGSYIAPTTYRLSSVSWRESNQTYRGN